MIVRILLLLYHLGCLVDSVPVSNSSLSDDLILSSERTPTREPKGITPSIEDVHYQSDCSEPLNAGTTCSVHIVECSQRLFDEVTDEHVPPEAHDVRISPIAKAMGSSRIDRSKHRLHVDVSWQIPQKATSKYLRAFKLQVSGPNNTATCFLFNVSRHENTDSLSQRYRFSSNTLFDFNTNYTVTIFSLPRSAKKIPKVSVPTGMPEDPDAIPRDSKDLEEYCRTHTNKQASKWAASFRKIFLFSVSRIIQIEFLAAPPQYCFEEYEVRLLDSSGIVMLQSAIIKRSELRTEMIKGRLVQFGEHNFTDIEIDVDLIPSVIPIETSTDGRCLCDTDSGCGCLAADWKPIKLAKSEKAVAQNTTTAAPAEKATVTIDTAPKWRVYTAVLIGSLVVLFLLSGCIILCMYQRFEKKKKMLEAQLRGGNEGYLNSGVHPLITPIASCLILYTHDCAQHEAAVVAFAELLRDLFQMRVHMDIWDEDDIEANRTEYINESIVRVDKVIIINSIGTFKRMMARHNHETPYERIVPGIFDDLFEQQISLALQHVRVLSVRFCYTPTTNMLFSLSTLLHYAIPENLSLLTSTVIDSIAPNDRLAGFSPQLCKLQAAISRMVHYIEREPDWFELNHHQVIRRAPTPETIVEELTIPEMVCSKSEDAYLGSEEEATRSATVDELEEEEEVESIGENDQLLDDVRNEVKDLDDSGCLDSAYISGSDFSQSDVNDMIMEKRRLASKTDPDHDVTTDSAFHDDVIGVH